MVSFWPWGRDDSSPASFEKALSHLSTKITETQGQLDRTRAKARRVKVLSTLYLGFAYLVYAIVLMLVVGWKSMGPIEWSGMAGGPLLIYAVRTVATAIYEYWIDKLSTRLKEYQTERAKTIQKLKDATKYDSTLQLLEKYGGPENKHERGKKDGGDQGLGAGADRESVSRPQSRQMATPQRTGLAPPPTANIQRRPGSAHGTPRPTPQGPALSPPRPQELLDMEASAEFAPNAFDGKGPPAFVPPAPAVLAAPAESHWYDRILDTLLGEDETAAKNRIVLICSKCRLVNGQAPPGTKSLSELGTWKCMGCGATNGEIDEGSRIVREVLGASPGTKAEAVDESSDMGDASDSDAGIPEGGSR